jgi:hypothetical protein
LQVRKKQKKVAGSKPKLYSAPVDVSSVPHDAAAGSDLAKLVGTLRDSESLYDQLRALQTFRSEIKALQQGPGLPDPDAAALFGFLARVFVLPAGQQLRSTLRGALEAVAPFDSVVCTDALSTAIGATVAALPYGKSGADAGEGAGAPSLSPAVGVLAAFLELEPAARALGASGEWSARCLAFCAEQLMQAALPFARCSAHCTAAAGEGEGRLPDAGGEAGEGGEGGEGEGGEVVQSAELVAQAHACTHTLHCAISLLSLSATHGNVGEGEGEGEGAGEAGWVSTLSGACCLLLRAARVHADNQTQTALCLALLLQVKSPAHSPHCGLPPHSPHCAYPAAAAPLLWGGSGSGGGGGGGGPGGSRGRGGGRGGGGTVQGGGWLAVGRAVSADTLPPLPAPPAPPAPPRARARRRLGRGGGSGSGGAARAPRVF